MIQQKHTQIQTVFCEINGYKWINEVNGTIDTDDAVQLHQDASKNVSTNSDKILVFSYYQKHIYNCDNCQSISENDRYMLEIHYLI